MTSARLLDGKKLAAQVRKDLAQQISLGLAAGLARPGLATVLVGEDSASQVYVRSKRKACEECGIANFHEELPAKISPAALLEVIQALNENEGVHGILLQLPLPAGHDEAEALASILPAKDVDGFHPVNQGRLWQGTPGLRPCTPLGILRLFQETGLNLQGKKAVVVGRSNIVGKPVAALLLEQHATVSLCHSRTRDLAAEVAAADVVIAAVGRPGLIQGAWIQPGAVVFDVGINRLPNGRLVGDVVFEEASKRASWITPVPGGVGPMTIAMLMTNTVQAAWGEFAPTAS